MCGVAGLAGTAQDREVLEKMAAAIAHRGPDSEGFLVDNQAGLAFRRLSIIDVAGGNQPIFNEEESAAIILNGEIYNHHELRKGLVQRGHRFRTRSDVEGGFHLWGERGGECRSGLPALFRLGIGNRGYRSLLLRRACAGKNPVYYSRLSGGGSV